MCAWRGVAGGSCKAAVLCLIPPFNSRSFVGFEPQQSSFCLRAAGSRVGTHLPIGTNHPMAWYHQRNPVACHAIPDCSCCPGRSGLGRKLGIRGRRAVGNTSAFGQDTLLKGTNRSGIKPHIAEIVRRARGVGLKAAHERVHPPRGGVFLRFRASPRPHHANVRAIATPELGDCRLGCCGRGVAESQPMKRVFRRNDRHPAKPAREYED